LAGETWKIENFYEFDRTGDPMLDNYRVLGAKMRGVPVDPNDGAMRQHGKTLTMAFTFGAGPNVWRQYVPDDPRSNDEIMAQEVMQFRRLHPRQTRLMNVKRRRYVAWRRASRLPAIATASQSMATR
jgi:hypothetical protein